MQNNKTEQQNSVYSDVRQFKKSNTLIESIYNSSLLENKLLSYGLAKAEYKEGRMVSVITTGEIRKIFGITDDEHIYSKLKTAAIKMTGQKIFIEDIAKKSFSIINIIGSATYAGGIFTIKFEPDLTDYLTDLKSNYTLFDIQILMSIDNVYAYRLYEILKSKAYHTGFSTDKHFTASFGLSELKLLIGTVDTTSDKVSKALKRPSPDYDYIVNRIAKENAYSRWDNFKRRILEPSIKEINDKTDLYVTYSFIREGYGGKISTIVFTFEKKPDINVVRKANITEEEFEAMIDELINYFEIPLKIKDAKALLSAAGYNAEIVKKAHDMAMEKDNINNHIAWMISAIKKNFIDI